MRRESSELSESNYRQRNVKKSQDSQLESDVQSYKNSKVQQTTKNKSGKSSQTNISSKILISCLYSYIKKVKVSPKALIPHLQKREKKYDPEDDLIYYPFHPKDLNFSVKTREGKLGVLNLIRYLEDLQIRQNEGIGKFLFYVKVAKEVSVEWSHQLHLAASKRVQAMQNGDGTVQSLDVGQLVNQFAAWKGPLFEIVVYGFIDPKQILTEAFLEDDSKLKNNRLQFFNEGGRFVGIDMGFHKKYRVVTVIIFAGGVNKMDKNKNSFPVRRQTGGDWECNIW